MGPGCFHPRNGILAAMPTDQQTASMGPGCFHPRNAEAAPALAAAITLQRRGAETRSKRRAHATTASWWNGLENPRVNMPPRMGAWQPGRLLHALGYWRGTREQVRVALGCTRRSLPRK